MTCRYDTDGSGHLDVTEVKEIVKDVEHHYHATRYAAYSLAFARAFRYLAFTSGS